jgi:lysophospholipase L1-like esterase
MTPAELRRARGRLRPTRLFGALLVATACVRGAPAAAPRAAMTDVGIMPAPATASAFEPEIAAFEARDRVDPPPRGGIVFVGSSSIRLWPDLTSVFPAVSVLNRGFGGSTLPDVIYFAPRIVLPYAPREVVLYAGDNDLAAGRTPEQVLGDYTAFVRLVRRTLPAARIIFISIKPSPSRWALAEPTRAANALIARAIARDTLATFVDVFAPMLGASGRPRPELFQADSLHMTPAGYALWRARLAPLIH